MPLRIVEEGKYSKPVIVCDHCGETISRARDGNYQWRTDTAESKGFAIYYTHKNCCHAFEEKNPGDWGAMELDCLIVYLANNLKLDWEAAKRRVGFLDSIG